MTVETASVSSSSLLVPPKKRDFSDYPLQVASSSDMDLTAHGNLHHHHLLHHSDGPPSPPADGRHCELSPSGASTSSSSSSSVPCKSEPVKSGFMITDILSPHHSGGLRLSPLAAAAAHHLVRLPSPHGTASSDAGSYKENDDMSDDGEGMLRNISMFFPFVYYSWLPNISVIKLVAADMYNFILLR
jgi:hypothetical protein